MDRRGGELQDADCLAVETAQLYGQTDRFCPSVTLDKRECSEMGEPL